ncbi:glycosyltransferase family 87 protein [Bradyrhizobium sp. AS23.2]|uniref:glycosyltransferase family 87 protein n=1 Tax=Bradyrhizobium sp. AS23.2 TaxID=1680155 RepID=UPI000AF1E9E8|nr:glycosyltransferase family 87 protein [Bradyrhizobium sp. AS23.2]
MIGLVCLNVERRQLVAGLALGAMVIKPHLAIAVSLYLLATRRWIALGTAAAVVLASSLLCTLLFGWQIWTAWLGAIRESASYLEQGFYPLFRMIRPMRRCTRPAFRPAPPSGDRRALPRSPCSPSRSAWHAACRPPSRSVSRRWYR